MVCCLIFSQCQIIEIAKFAIELELVVAESVLVLTRLLQVPSEERSKSVIALVKLLDTLKVPMARANILWLVGQYAETLPKVGPDVLRQAVKSFANEVIAVVYRFRQLNLTYHGGGF